MAKDDSFELGGAATTGLAGVAFAGFLIIISSSSIAGYNIYALACFIFCMPLAVGLYFTTHPETGIDIGKSKGIMNLVVATFIITAIVTVTGYSFILANISLAIGIAFFLWSTCAPILLYYAMYKGGVL